MIIYHEFLVRGETLLECKTIVTKFLKTNGLAMPIEFYFIDERTIPATHEVFYKRLETAIKENKNVLTEFINELRKNNITKIDDLTSLNQGFLSKTLHTISHILDGFFGIDAFFYNLIEDSYFVSEELFNAIKSQPQKYFLVSTEAIYSENNPLSFEKFLKT